MPKKITVAFYYGSENFEKLIKELVKNQITGMNSICQQNQIQVRYDIDTQPTTTH